MARTVAATSLGQRIQSVLEHICHVMLHHRVPCHGLSAQNDALSRAHAR
jgi:hypothetical protein